MSKLTIPKTFKLMGLDYEVGYSDTLLRENDMVGCHCPRSLRITLHQSDHVTKQKAVEHTYCHEITHAILEHMGEPELCHNEKFVDMFGGLLHQILTTSEGDLDE